MLLALTTAASGAAPFILFTISACLFVWVIGSIISLFWW